MKRTDGKPLAQGRGCVACAGRTRLHHGCGEALNSPLGQQLAWPMPPRPWQGGQRPARGRRG